MLRNYSQIHFYMKKIFLLIYVLSLFKITVAQQQTPEVTSLLYRPVIQTYEPKIRNNKLMLSTFELQTNSIMPIFAMGLQYERILSSNKKFSMAFHGKIGERFVTYSTDIATKANYYSYGLKFYYNPFAGKKIEYSLGLDGRFEYINLQYKLANNEVQNITTGMNYMLMHRFVYNIKPNLFIGSEAGIGLFTTYKNLNYSGDLNLSMQLINIVFGIKF